MVIQYIPATPKREGYYLGSQYLPSGRLLLCEGNTRKECVKGVLGMMGEKANEAKAV